MPVLMLCFGFCSALMLLIVRLLHWKVKCWFCEFTAYTPWSKRNSFVCQQCGQYNGFTSDGNYNKVIPSQFTTELNPTGFRQVHATFTSRSDVLCSDCAHNQNIIIQKLSEYIPENKTSDDDIKEYTRLLDLKYSLCLICYQKVTERIRTLDSKLLPNFIEWWHDRRKTTSVNRDSFSHKTHRETLAWLELLVVLRVIVILCFLSVVTGPLLTEIGKQTCLIHVATKKSYTYKLIEVFLSSNCRHYFRGYCTEILAYSQHFSPSIFGQILFTSLMFFLQITLIVMYGFGYINTHCPHQRLMYHDGLQSMVLVYDVSMLLISTNIFLSFLPNIDNSNVINFITFSTSFIHITSLCFFVLMTSLIIIIYGTKIWLSFFRNDCMSQQKTLRNTWPGGSGLSCLQSNDSMTYYRIPSYCSVNLITSSLNSSGKSLEDKLAAATISPVKSENIFRPSVFSDTTCSSVVGSQYSTLSSYSAESSSLYFTQYDTTERQVVESYQPNEDALSYPLSISYFKPDSNSLAIDCNSNCAYLLQSLGRRKSDS
ncbi:hypothetical protein MN116_005530 [Schistosoma mekongi]|uniref:Ima1 N-terminal domain-containing protein n=1 Tax=Schistosoma mekongi TaxID=38744 RepID=A0AAE1ZCQ5_SCHME|nr:hypothetical protein MN116_005530 [Schistosoma mekongi]